MGKGVLEMSRLIDLITRIDEFDEEEVIFVKGPWEPGSEARLFRLTSEGRAPAEAEALGFTYFLEVDVARQVLDEFVDSAASEDRKCTRIIQYATYDA